MNKYLIQFDDMHWITPAKGIRYKEYSIQRQRIRLAEFSEGFFEADWCTKGHTGFVLDGTFKINLTGKEIRFKSGDGLWIPKGDIHKHKAILGKGEKVRLILFEEID